MMREPLAWVRRRLRGLIHPGPTRRGDRSYYTPLSLDPPVFLGVLWLPLRPAYRSYRALFEALADRRAHFLFLWWWQLGASDAVAVGDLARAHGARFPGHRFTFLCNTPEEEARLRGQGLDALVCSANCLVDERIFRPLPGARPWLDAVYDARFAAYKRHELAQAVASLGLLYLVEPHADDMVRVRAVRRALARAHFFNHPPTWRPSSSPYARLSPEAVNACLVQCRVGLCLSAVEGAMRASVQYLLAGLPVVSTPALGGRDAFFDDEVALVVPADPVAVRRGVAEMVGRRLAPERVRALTLARLAAHRERLLERVQAIYDAEGAGRRIADEWPGLFVHTMTPLRLHAPVIASLGGASPPPWPRGTGC